jgi:hypothetical protein
MTQSAVAVASASPHGSRFMTRLNVRVLLGAWCFVAGAFAQGEGPAPEARDAASRPAEIPWRRDLAAARTEARALRKPLCVVFRCEA